MKKTLTTAVAVLALGATMAFAAPHEGGKGHKAHGGRGGFSQKLAEKLNLTETQKQHIKDIEKTSREHNRAFFQASRETKMQFKAAKEANDNAKLDALKATFESQRAQMKQIREAEMQKISAILTAEQRAKLEQLKADRGQRWQNKQ